MSPSAKRAWIEMAILSEAVCSSVVALCEEGVDRNKLCLPFQIHYKASPSAKRAWIEIENEIAAYPLARVALCEEGVDRNKDTDGTPQYGVCRPLRRGRG